MSEVILEFDNEDMAHAFVVNILNQGDDVLCDCSDDGEIVYFDWDSKNSKKLGASVFYNYLRFTLEPENEN